MKRRGLPTRIGYGVRPLLRMFDSL